MEGLLFIMHVRDQNPELQNISLKIHCMIADDFGQTPIHAASANGNVEILEHFMTSGERVEFNKQCYSGMTPLHYAIKREQTEAVKCLVEYGVNMKIKDQDGDTPLHLACQRSHADPDVVKILLQYTSEEIDLDARCQVFGTTAIQYAIMNDYKDIVNAWLESGHEITFDFQNEMGYNILHLTCQNGSVDVVNMVLAKLGEQCSQAFNETDEDGNTPLHCACLARNSEIVKLILQFSKILNLNLETRNLQNLTPYEVAVKDQTTSIMKLFENHFE